jgi:hypothetical protein
MQRSYDVSITNTGVDDLSGPLVLLLDPGRYFTGGIEGATGSGIEGEGEQSDLWLLDLTAAIDDLDGSFRAGATLAGQTVSIIPASRFAPRAGLSDLVKVNLGHGIYAFAPDNAMPGMTLGVDGEDGEDGEYGGDELPMATVGEAWTAELEAVDTDGARFYWQLVEAPAGMELTAGESVLEADGHHSKAVLAWTPNANADAETEILVRIEDSRGGVLYRRLAISVAGGNHAPCSPTRRMAGAKSPLRKAKP